MSSEQESSGGDSNSHTVYKINLYLHAYNATRLTKRVNQGRKS